MLASPAEHGVDIKLNDPNIHVWIDHRVEDYHQLPGLLSELYDIVRGLVDGAPFLCSAHFSIHPFRNLSQFSPLRIIPPLLPSPIQFRPSGSHRCTLLFYVGAV